MELFSVNLWLRYSVTLGQIHPDRLKVNFQNIV